MAHLHLGNNPYPEDHPRSYGEWVITESEKDGSAPLVNLFVRVKFL